MPGDRGSAGGTVNFDLILVPLHLLMLPLLFLFLSVNPLGDDMIRHMCQCSELTLLSGLLVCVPLPGLHDQQRIALALGIIPFRELGVTGVRAAPRGRWLRPLGRGCYLAATTASRYQAWRRPRRPRRNLTR